MALWFHPSERGQILDPMFSFLPLDRYAVPWSSWLQLVHTAEPVYS